MYSQPFCCVKEEFNWTPVLGSKRTNDKDEGLNDDFWSYTSDLSECKSLLNTTCPDHLTLVGYDGEDICCPLLGKDEEGQDCYRLYDDECAEGYQSMTYNGETICCGEETDEVESRAEKFDFGVKIKHLERMKNETTAETKKKVQMVQKCQIMEQFTPCPLGYLKKNYRSMGVCCGQPYRRAVMTTVEEDETGRDLFEVNIQELKDYEELSTEGSIFRGPGGKCHVLSDATCEEGYKQMGPVCCKFGKHPESKEDIDTELEDFIDDKEKGDTGECENVDQCGRSKRPVASLIQENRKRTRRLKVSLKIIPGFLTGKFEEIQGRTEAKARFASTDITREIVLSEDHLNVLKPYLTKIRTFEVPVIMVSAENGEEIKQFSIVEAGPDASLKIAEEQDYDGRRGDVQVSLGALVEAKASLADLTALSKLDKKRPQSIPVTKKLAVEAETALEDWLKIR